MDDHPVRVTQVMVKVAWRRHGCERVQRRAPGDSARGPWVPAAETDRGGEVGDNSATAAWVLGDVRVGVDKARRIVGDPRGLAGGHRHGGEYDDLYNYIVYVVIIKSQFPF